MSNDPPYTSRKLAKLAGVEHRTLMRWIAADLLSPTPFHGPKTTYDRRHLQEARAIIRLRADNLTYAAIARRLRGLSDEDLARFVRVGDRPPAPAPAAPVAPPPAVETVPSVAIVPSPPAAPEPPPVAPEPSGEPARLEGLGASPGSGASATSVPKVDGAEATPPTSAESWTEAHEVPSDPWERVVLLPGLELLVRLAAGPLVRRLAAEIREHYEVRAPPPLRSDGPR